MKKANNTSGADHGHHHGSKDPDERKKQQLNIASSNSGSETDARSYITQPFARQWTSGPGGTAASDGNVGDAIREVNFSSEEMENLQARHQLSLFAKVFGRRVGFHKMSSHIHRVWNPQGRLDVIPLENDFYLLKFSDVSDYNKALQGVPWMIDHHYITLHRWSPNFKPSEAIITGTAVWIRLQELPVEYYYDEALPKIAAVIGRPVKIDPVTEMRLKCKFARVCVELDLQEPLPSYVKLPNGIWQPIQYEGLHVLCHECRRVGHFQEDCLYRASVSTSPPPERSASCVPSSLNNSFVYGPWLPQLTYHSGHSIGSGPPAWSSGFQGLAGAPSDSGANLEQDRAITPPPGIYRKKMLEFANPQIGEGSSSTLHRIKTYEQNKPVPTPSTQAQRTEEVTKGEIEASYEPEVFPEYFSLYASNSSSPVPTMNQVVSAPPIPSFTGLQSVSSPRIEMFSQAMLKAVVKREINIAPVEIKERSTEGCPNVFNIDSKVSELAIDVKISPLSSGNGKLQQITINPTSIDHTEYATPSSSTKKILSWNCRGASDPARIRAMNDLCKAHNPSILLLLETRTSRIDADRVIKGLGFTGSYCIDPEGHIGGVWLLWPKENVQVNVTPGTSDHIHTVARFSPIEGYEPQEWIVYGLDSDQD